MSNNWPGYHFYSLQRQRKLREKIFSEWKLCDWNMLGGSSAVKHEISYNLILFLQSGEILLANLLSLQSTFIPTNFATVSLSLCQSFLPAVSQTREMNVLVIIRSNINLKSLVYIWLAELKLTINPSCKGANLRDFLNENHFPPWLLTSRCCHPWLRWAWLPATPRPPPPPPPPTWPPLYLALPDQAANYQVIS